MGSIDGKIKLYDPVKDVVSNVIDFSTKGTSRPPKFMDVYLWGNYYWLTTHTSGIYQLDKNTLNVVRHHSLKVDSKILASVGMKDAIWIATESNEIKQVLLPNLEVVLTLSSTKLELNDYSEGAITKTKENALVFGGNRGFHYFHPELLTFDQFTDIP